ncbi:ABC transporter ATP-binding protein [Pedobacter sp. 22226]|uniref:ABC transporter ATP-binding protein n=1 Tax=Pedobacter sp. 22226 TaxID=3453894 RepID=UPI003F845AB0
MSNIAIKVENLSKAYQLGQIGTGTISRDLERWYARIRGKEDPFLRIGESNDQNTKSESDVVWSLKDINFEIEQGDAVGIIGRNGAGKSTLLKILSKVTAPTTGKISGKGRIASLLEVGTGFHPELSGRENIFLNGAILGMRKKEIQRKLDEIVDFAGIERYLDTPVKRYSSGMYVRLAFAVAAHLESEILIVDEVLAVGDAEFQKKCLGKMGEVSKGEGRTVLFVSHNMDAVSSLCKNGIVLENGKVKIASNVEEAIRIYQQFNQNEILRWDNLHNNYFPRFDFVTINITGSQPNLLLNIKAQLVSDSKNAPAFITFDIKDDQGKPIIQSMPSATPFIIIQKGIIDIDLVIALTGLVPGFYSISPWIGPQNTITYDRHEDVLVFEITQSPTKDRVFPYYKSDGFISAPTTAEIKYFNQE